MSDRIHAHGQGYPHPFKGGTLCGKTVRFGRLECEGRAVTCKVCLRVVPLAREFDALRNRVQVLMGWDVYKADAWMKADNPHLGGAAPIDLIRKGRGHKVAQFIAASETENKPLEDA